MSDNPTPIALSYSGGKDSAICLWELTAAPQWEVKTLVTTVQNTDRKVPMHGVEASQIEAQARRLDISIRIVELPERPSNKVYERQMRPVFDELTGDGVKTVAFGDLFVEDIRHYRESQMAAVGLKAAFPIWGRETADVARQFIGDGWRAVLTGVDTEQLDRSFLGRYYDEDLLDDLPEKVDVCGENGEFHTFVFDGPLFSEPIDVTWRIDGSQSGRFQFVSLS